MDASKKQLGQYFTRHAGVHTSMVSLISHIRGRALEPSAGEGHLAAVLEEHRPGLELEVVEIDTRLSQRGATPVTHADFFTWSAGREGAYSVIFGNPPFVPWRDVPGATRQTAAACKARYGDKTNLYHLFIDRAVDLLEPGGELVFIVPKEWLYTTSAAPLRDKLAAEGSITHLVDCGEERLFADASVPALLIFRFVKGVEQDVAFYPSLQAHLDGRATTCELRREQSRWMLLPAGVAAATAGWGRLGDTIDVKVGLVTGLDAAFRVSDPSQLPDRFVRQQLTTRRVAEPFLDANHVDVAADLPAQVRAHLDPFKSRLLGRRIARFGEHNWWKYGAVRNAEAMASDTPRLYANAKTRREDPFFLHDATHFGGGILGLFLQAPWQAGHLPQIVELLNSALVRELLVGMFLTSGDKLSLQPATLADLPFPTSPAALEEALALVRKPLSPAA